MKSILAVAALLAGLAGPALAEDAASTPAAPAPQAAAPSTEIVVPTAAPQAEVEGDGEVMTLPAEPSVAKGSSGCGRDKTVYLTN